MGSSARNKSKVYHLALLEDLPSLIKDNVQKSDVDKYQETTAKQIEILQGKLAKEHDSKNEIIFWYIFTVLFLLDCLAFEHINTFIGVFGLLLMEVVALVCAANKLGQEHALQLLIWVKNIIEKVASKNNKESNKENSAN